MPRPGTAFAREMEDPFAKSEINIDAGWVAAWYNYQMVYIFGALSCLAAMLLLFPGKERPESG